MPKSDSNKKTHYVLASSLIFGLLVILPVLNKLSSGQYELKGLVLKSMSMSSVFFSKLLYDILAYVISFFTIHTIIVVVIVCFTKLLTEYYKLKPCFSILLNVLVSLMFIIWVHIGNSIYYPYSILSWLDRSFSFHQMQKTVFSLLSVVVVMFFLTSICYAVFTMKKSKIWQTSKNYFYVNLKIVIFAMGMIAIASSAYIFQSSNASIVHAIPTQPNIIFIGIDSLRGRDISIRPDLLKMPHLSNILEESVVFDTAYTPLARTYPSWVSILTGLHPIRHGARFNLIERENRKNKIYSIAERLKDRGYHTVYATDEKRFSNIDESFGFDKIIGPSMGAGDFLLGSFNDFPVTNLVSNSLVGKVFFPYTYSNRATAITYKPETFSKLLSTSIKNNNQLPLFLATHFCLPHWPFTWSDSDLNTSKHNRYELYLKSLQYVDQQVGQLFTHLETTGLLKNSIVVLLSDHGESFAHDQENYFTRNDLLVNSEIAIGWASGHGIDVLNRKQYEVLLAFRGFGRYQFSPNHFDQHASLMDITPTILDMLNINVKDVEFDGISLLPWISEKDISIKNRLFFIETGLIVPAMLNASVDENKIFNEGAKYYTIKKNGRSVIDKKYMPTLLKEKRYAVYNNNITYADLPNSVKYIQNSILDHNSKEIIYPNSPVFDEYVYLKQSLEQYIQFYKNESDY